MFVAFIFKFSKQYNVIISQNITIKNLILSWIVGDNDVLLSISRNYNKRTALIGLDSSKVQSYGM